MSETRQYPPWKEAVDTFKSLFEEHGYNAKMTHKELRELLGIPTQQGLQSDFMKGKFKDIVAYDLERDNAQLKYADAIKHITTELLTEHNLDLQNIPTEGYQVRHPDEQIEKSVKKYMRKSRRFLVYSYNLSQYVREEDITDTEKLLFVRRQLAFQLDATRSKKQYPLPENKSGQIHRIA